jgi:Kef-type K+ transport system membrane component KefB
MKENFSQVVLAAAVIDDILGVFILVVISQLSGQFDNIILQVSKLGFYLLVFFIFAPFVSQIMMKIVEIFSKKLDSLDFIPAAVISVIFIFSFISHKFGSPEILGAFVVGLSLSSGFGGIKFLATEKQTIQKIEHSITPLVWLLSPIFFVFIGLQVNIKNINFLSIDFWVLVLVIGLVAFVSKIVAGFVFKDGGLREKLMIGFSLLPRGEVGLIFAEIGRQNKIYDESLYFIIVFVVLLTTFVSPLALRNINRIFQKGS